METETPSTDPSPSATETGRRSGAAHRSVLLKRKRVKRRRIVDGVTRHLLRVMLALSFLLIGAVGYGAYRLSQGPLPLDFVLEPLTQTLSSLSGHTVRARAAAVAWDRESGNIGLDLTWVSVSTPEGVRLVTMPAAWLQLSGHELVRGRIKPTELRLNGLTLRGVRSENGAFALGVESTTGGEAPVPEVEPAGTASPTQWLIDLLGLGEAEGLREVRLRDARFFILDDRTGVEWPITDVSANLQTLTPGTITGSMTGTLTLQQQATHIALTGQYDFFAPEKAEDDRITLGVDIDQIMPAAIATRLPGLPELSGIELPSKLTLRTTLDGNGRPISLNAALKAGKGRLVQADLPTGAVAIDEAEVQVKFDQGKLEVDLPRLMLATGTVLTGKIAADQLHYPITLSGSVGVKSLTLADLPSLWPATVAPNPRRWIFANLAKGGVTEATALFKATLPAKDADPEVHDLTAGLKATNIAVSYLGKLPPVDGVNGTLTYTHSDGKLTMAMQDGKLRGSGLTVPNGSLTISGLKAPDQRMALQLAILGPVQDALTLLDQPPLGFMKRFGIEPKTSQGDAKITLTMGFPLLDALKVEQLDIAAEAEVTRAAVQNVIEDVSLSDANLTLKVTQKGLTGAGTGRLNGVAFKIDWAEPFTGAAGRSLNLIGTVNDAGRAALKLPGDSYVSGPIDLTVAYTEPAPKQARVQVKADLTRARFEVADILYVKPIGEAAQGSAELVMENNRLTQVSRFEYRAAGGGAAEGSVQFDSKLDITQAVLRRAQLPGTDLAATFRRGRDGWAISLDGKSLDLTRMMADRAKQPPNPTPTPMTANLTAKLGKLILGPKREAHDVSFRLQITRDLWQELGFNAKIGAGNASAVLRGAGDDRRLHVEAQDAGAALAFGGIIDTVRGGVLTLDGQPDPEGWRGQAKMTAYRLVDEPVLGKILTIASITGIPQMLSGEGIAFDNASIDFRANPQRILLSNGRTTGLSIGFKLDGRIDRTTDRLDMNGTLVPMAGINRVLNAIPLIGNILTGGEGGGIFAWTFRVTGPMLDPQVSVNPLSGFAPGIFRWIFEGGPPSENGNGSPSGPPPPFQTPDNR